MEKFFRMSRSWTQRDWPQQGWWVSWSHPSEVSKNNSEPDMRWADSLDEVQLEMMLMDILEADLEESNCSSARELLHSIGIRC